jgi:3-dehydroquinate synthase
VDRESAEGFGKNFAGTFYPADEVWVRPAFLSSLPLRERISGAGEVWKTLWLAGKREDRALLDFVEEGGVSLELTRLLRLCLETKKRIVAEDPLDNQRIRERLNYGHTVGHALESLAAGKLSHGEAVLWGMRVESGLLGKKAAKMSALVEEKIRALKLGLPEAFSLPPESWLPFLRADKKSKKGLLEMSVLEAPGKLRRLRCRPEALAAKIRAFPGSFRH